MFGIKSYWNITHVGADGNILGKEYGPNIFHNDGEKLIIHSVFTGHWDPVSDIVSDNVFYVGLDSRSELAQDDTLDMNTIDDQKMPGEPDSGFQNYTRQPINRAFLQDEGVENGWDIVYNSETEFHAAESSTVRFTCEGPDENGEWPTLKNAFLCTLPQGPGQDNGLLISTRPMKADRKLFEAESLDVTVYISIEECN